MIREFYGLEDCECGYVETRTWVARPSDDRLLCPSCGVCRRLKTVRENYRAFVPSTSAKRFTPHFNRSFGCEVESREHLKQLQIVHGTEDFKVGRAHSDGSCDYTSRDIDTGAAERRKKADEVLAEWTAAEDPELDYNEDGSWTRTELAEDE
jgi:hypothetical protein